MNHYNRDFRTFHQDERINVFQAAMLTGFSSNTLNKMRCVGGGPKFEKVGRKVVYRVGDLTRWKKQGQST